MTPKEKAEELVDRFSEYSHTDFNYSRGGYQVDTQIQNAKQCALIAVDEMIKQNGEIYLNSLGDKTIDFYKTKNAYLFEVKKEIENL